MKLSKQEYQAIVENSPNLIWRAGLDSLCNYFNHTWLTFTGRTLKQESGNGWASGVHPDDLDRCIKIYLENFQRRTPFEMEYRLRRHDGEWRWINDRGVPFFHEDGSFAGYIGSCLDVTDNVEGVMYKEMAQKDSLTGVLSRQYMMSILTQSIVTALQQKHDLSIAMMDIDQFKQINDRHGHLIGDKALQQFTSVVQSQIRSTDKLGRFGGDEFVILFLNAAKDAALRTIHRIGTALQAAAITADTGEIVLSMSYGISDLSDGVTCEALLHAADQRMYRDKLKDRCGIDMQG